MNANNYKSKGVLIGLVALAAGVAIGVAGTEIGHTSQRQNNTESSLALVGTPGRSTGSNQWDPFREIQMMQEQMNQSLDDMSRQFKQSDTNQPAPAPGANPWDPFQEIQRMQSQMDQSFNQMFDQFRMQPQFDFLQANPNYSTSINVQNLKDCYLVHAFLPDAKTSDVHVTLNNGQTLTVEVNSRQGEKSNQTNAVSQASEWGQYEQTVQLPTPVKQNQMTVKHEGHDLIITIPKAG
ncbi:MAG TPA: Hsp20 family protein [Verrucomicrobiae bacterium]|nr:Hsp20 family protein [Verrucomicrobiae bacterium]